MARSLRAIADLLFDIARELNHRSRPPIDQAILDRLALEDLSGNALAYALRRNAETVHRTCRLLEQAGKIRRIGSKWSLL
jgi:hypothetical protein